MSVDFAAIADAIAVRFGPTVITAPGTETNVTQSTAVLPDAITDEPVVLVFPPESIEFHFGPSSRTAVTRFPVLFYIYRVRDTPRNAALLNAWLGALYDQLDGAAQLGASFASYVTSADVVRMAVRPLTYGGIEFHGIEITVEVRTAEGVNYVA